jgi:RHS repeat-associated protein
VRIRENDGTGLYYYRARYYSPELQRFISQDPILRQILVTDINFAKHFRMPIGHLVNLIDLLIRDPKRLHAFSYTQNNPVNSADPSGYLTCQQNRAVCYVVWVGLCSTFCAPLIENPIGYWACQIWCNAFGSKWCDQQFSCDNPPCK